MPPCEQALRTERRPEPLVRPLMTIDEHPDTGRLRVHRARRSAGRCRSARTGRRRLRGDTGRQACDTHSSETRSSSADAVTSVRPSTRSARSSPDRSTRRHSMQTYAAADPTIAHSLRQFGQQPLIVVHEQPVLVGSQMRREIAHVRPRAGREVERTHDSWRQRIGGNARNRQRARRRSAGSRSASQSAENALIAAGVRSCSAWWLPPAGEAPPMSRHLRRTAPTLAGGRAHVRAPCASCARYEGSAMTRESASASASASPAGTTTPASDSTRSPIAPVLRGDNRQAACQRFGDDHAVALVQRRQHEDIGRCRNSGPGRRRSSRRRSETRSSSSVSTTSCARSRRTVAGSRSRLPTHVRRQFAAGWTRARETGRHVPCAG